MTDRLLLPGEGSRVRLDSGLPLVAMALAVGWVCVRATLLPALRLDAVPFDPVLPVIGAFALSGRRSDAWVASLGLGWIQDVLIALGTGRALLHAAIFTALLQPLHGRIVIADRGVPAVGIVFCAFTADLLVAFLLLLVGAPEAQAATHLGGSATLAVSAGIGSVLMWPMLRRIADADRSRRGLR